MKPRSKPRYRDAERPPRGPKARPLVLKRTSPLAWWGRLAFRWIVLYTVLPLALLWVANLALNPYRVHFDARPSNVTLDGHPLALDSANGFDLTRFSPGDHLLRFVDAEGGAKTLRLHARVSDENGDLTISDQRASGVPKAEFVKDL